MSNGRLGFALAIEPDSSLVGRGRRRDHLKPHQRRCGTGIWPDRDISTASADLDEQVRVSADRAANPAAHTRATRAALDRRRLGLCETRTVRWREPDSNHRYRSYEMVSRLLPNGDAGPINWRGH